MKKFRIWLIKLLAGDDLSLLVNVTLTGGIKAWPGTTVFSRCYYEPEPLPSPPSTK